MPAVAMTTAEWAVLSAHPAAEGRTLITDTSREGWVALRAQPCPFYSDAGGCAVYDVRPYNCRRFQCGRWEPSRQPFAIDPMPVIRADNDLRWSYSKNQRQHAAWALAHGWEAGS